MKPRPLVLTLLLAGAFWLVTSHGDWSLRQVIQPFSSSGKLWSDPVTAHGAGSVSNRKDGRRRRAYRLFLSSDREADELAVTGKDRARMVTTGYVKVMRPRHWYTPVRATSASVTSRTGSPGTRDAVWPSGPSPR